MSFRARLTLLVGAAVALSIAASVVILFLVVQDQLYAQLDAQLADRAHQVAAAAADVRRRCPDAGSGAPATSGSSPSPSPAPGPPGPGCPPAGSFPVPEPRPGASSGVIQLLDSTGTVAGPGAPSASLPISEAAKAIAGAGAGADLVEETIVDGVPMRQLTHAVEGGGAVQVALPRDGIEQVLANLRWLLLGVSLLGVVIAILLGRAIASSALRPVQRLTLATERVAGTHDLRERVDEPGRDELGRLAHSFNRMLAALDASEQSRRRLVADASHELRTPLTSLRTNIELLALDTRMEQAERTEVLASLTGETERLSQLVADLMELARGDELATPAMTDVDLDVVVDEAVAVARIHHPGVTFVLRAEPSVVVGDPSRIRRAVDNLLDNAGKWSAAGASVEVEVANGEVSVRDHGPGIDEADRPHVFDRFWRSASARGTPGSGLGLAIVAQTALAHGGEARLESPRDGGSRFVLRLRPADKEPAG
jgi:two-component system sensor histidine kinase MprB